jgi:uncharacterized protein (TIGR03437 family)
MKVNSILLKAAAGMALGVVLSGYLFIDFPSKRLSGSAFAMKSGIAQTGDDGPGQIQVADEGDFVISERLGRIGCRNATREEAQAMRRRGPNQQMQVITPVSNDLAQQTGLKIILRGTPQLDSFPAARDAFLRAAAKWESIIQTPITVILDVDFGPKRFDETFEPTTIGSTSGQTLRLSTGYSSIRSRLISRASGTSESTLLNSLPTGAVPTDIGSTSDVIAPSALFRTLGVLSAVANPAAEPQQQFGPPPAIGFNSAFNFDFDPSDGIGSNKIDFDTAAVHEIGHVLGFTSAVGFKELDASATIGLTVWDLFRFRPGANLSTFSTAQRILSSGGDQSFFDGGGELGLSTARPDGEGGDENQASHWKADELTGRYIGLMDPSISLGKRDLLTDNDLRVLDVLGYRLRTVANQPGTAPSINFATATVDFGVVAANLSVDRLLTVRNTGAAVLNITDIISLNPNFSVVAITKSFSVAPGGEDTIRVRLSPAIAGNLTGMVSFVSNDPAKSTASVQVKATVGGSALPLSTVSAASFGGTSLASESIASAFGQNLATQLTTATTTPLPTSLANTIVRVRDGAGTQRDAPLFFVSPTQVNYLIPPGTENGSGLVTIISGNNALSSGSINITSTAPGLFSANANAIGAASALVLRARADGSQSFESVVKFDAGQNRFVPTPIDLSPSGDQVFLLLFGTGFRFRNNLSAVSVKVGGVDAQVSYAGAQGGFVGVDQINALLPRSLIGKGEVDVVITVDGRTSNTVRVNIK